MTTGGTGGNLGAGAGDTPGAGGGTGAGMGPLTGSVRPGIWKRGTPCATTVTEPSALKVTPSSLTLIPLLSTVAPGVLRDARPPSRFLQTSSHQAPYRQLSTLW